ncbi:MAG: formate/nitrite transporter family protein [Gaiellaceae bacterium]
MSGAPEPEEIYKRTKEEGERRLARPTLELASTAIAAGLDVVLGITALGLVSALVGHRGGSELGHLAGSVAFGIGFVFIVVGRSELFTENFLVPIAGLDRQGSSWWKLAELWTLSPLLNILGGATLVIVLTTHGVLPDGTGAPLVEVATKLDQNGVLAAFASAVAGGALITLMTWLVEGHDSMGVKILVSWITGTLLTLGAFNHVIVATLELFFGIRFGARVGWGDLFENFGIAAVGNIVGGLLFVTLNRTAQAKAGESAKSSD